VIVALMQQLSVDNTFKLNYMQFFSKIHYNFISSIFYGGYY